MLGSTKKNLKKMVREAAESPEQSRKDQFLRAIRKNQIQEKPSDWDILRSQIGYIRFPVWLVSLFALGFAVYGVYARRDLIFAVAALMPFVSGVAVLEACRARHYEMSELEGVTRLSRRGILLARIVCVGASHIALLLVLAVLMGGSSGYGYPMTGAILTLPYLLSSVASMAWERTALGRKSAVGCLGISALTSGGIFVVQYVEFDLSEPSCRALWYAAVLIMAAAECMEFQKLFRVAQSEP